MGTIRRVEIRYYSEHGYLTTNLDDLDIDVKGGIFFNLPVLKNVTYTGGNEVIASITRNSNTFSVCRGASEGLFLASGWIPETLFSELAKDAEATITMIEIGIISLESLYIAVIAHSSQKSTIKDYFMRNPESEKFILLQRSIKLLLWLCHFWF